MDFLRKYSLILGISILIVIVMLLLSSPDLFFSSGVTFISTDLYDSTGDEVYVETRMDFGENEYMNQFPTQIDVWSGYVYDSEKLKEYLGADSVVQIGYRTEGSFQPVFLSMVQSNTNSSFHPPKTCYKGLGYDIQEESKEHILIKDASWTKESSDVSIAFKKLVVAKESNGLVKDRRIALYFYVKGNLFTTDTITMIRYEAVASNDGSYDEELLEKIKSLAVVTIPLMFEPSGEEGGNTIVMEVIGWGVVGYFIIAFLLIIPVAIIVFPRTKWGRVRAEI